ncbi:MAG: TIGR04552 family protein [Bacteriovoracaceae bacterium]
MERPTYLSKYLFDWGVIDVIVNGDSPLDTKHFITPIHDTKQAEQFLRGYGFDPHDPVSKAELFGNFQEALSFIKKYFLKEGDAEGLDLKVPQSIYLITDIIELLMMTNYSGKEEKELEEKLWSEIILKVMHTILHVDKDLRTNYFNIIQTQVFDRFYKVLYRDPEDKLFLGKEKDQNKIALIDFETKSKKTRDSVIIKLLHKPENVAEELFDRIGVRFVTEKRSDTLKVVKYLVDNNVVVPHNIKPSRSINNLYDIDKLRSKHKDLVKVAIREQMNESDFQEHFDQIFRECEFVEDLRNKVNPHSLGGYRSIQFTARQLIKYTNPFQQQFNKLKSFARTEDPDSPLTQKILNMDVSLIARDIRFFYPFEIQVMDRDLFKINTEGAASHQDYKRAQKFSARARVFKSIMEFKGLSDPV